MTPTPTATALILCDTMIVDAGTNRPSLINCYTAARFPAFPTPPRTIYTFTYLTDGCGMGIAELVVSRTDDDTIVFRQNRAVRIANRLDVVQFGWTVTGLSFPSPGRYEFAIYMDAEFVVRQTIDVRGTS